MPTMKNGAILQKRVNTFVPHICDLWVESKFPLGMVTGRNMVLGGGSCPISIRKLLSSQFFFCFLSTHKKSR